MTRPAPARLAATLALALLAGGTALLTPSAAVAGPEKTNRGAVVDGASYDRLIVHFDSESSAAKDDRAAASEVAAVGKAAGHGLKVTRRLATGGALVQVDAKLDKAKTDRLIAKLVERAGVAYAEVDAVMTAQADPGLGLQWHYSEARAGLNAAGAWATGATGAGAVVAVLDTGITAHSDLDANVVPGYDFVSDAAAARDDNGRDAEATDKGDWYAAGECGRATGANSSWHGTHVAGTVAAVKGNEHGGSGVAYAAKVMPVRVLAKCGGSISDIADAIVWAAGGIVSGVPTLDKGADVINMSLGGSGSCAATYQTAINQAVARGTTVVVAAGNSNALAANHQPASCANTVVVAASDREGNRASYSNYGSAVDVTAPGGETVTPANGVYSTVNTGTTTPGGAGYAYYQGTSMATPHVAGVVALMRSLVPAMTPAEVETRLKSGTRALVGTCTGGCGAGLVDAATTVGAASTPLPPTRFANDVDVVIPDGGSADSPVTVTGRAGNAPSGLKAEVAIVHPRRGDLQIDLVAPDGSLYRLLSSRKNDTAPYAATTYTVNASAEAANGTWKLRVSDTRTGNTGKIDSWSLQF